MGDKIKVMVVDDHPVVRQGLRALFGRDDGFEVVGEASDGSEALRVLPQIGPDVVVMDLEMPNMNGIDATRKITGEYPEVRVVILTVHDEDNYIFQSLKAGATGYMLKTSSFSELAEAVRQAVNGTPSFSPTVSRKIMEKYLDEADEKKEDRARSGSLTNREREVLGQIAEGLTNNQIAKKIGISPKTVETHRTNLMRKLDIHDVASLTRYAIKSGLVVLGNG
jgi:DNA-binding NarL/FixJ family response regulator